LGKRGAHCAVNCARTAELIDLPFGMWTQVGRMEAQVQSYSPGGTNVRLWESKLAPPGEYD